jgi:hypothetical protein
MMLGWLPEDSNTTLASKEAKNVFKTFDLIKAELQYRTNIMKASIIEKSASRSVLLSQVYLPADVFLHVLVFLPRHEAVHQASLVSKSWLAVARSPQC